MIKDLQLCDWVLLNDIPVQVDAITKHSAWHQGECFEPKAIALSEEILKMNGFRESIEEGTYYFPKGYKAHERGYAIENEDGLWFITGHNLMPFVYIHELQHALRLCGLHDLADNFKITED